MAGKRWHSQTIERPLDLDPYPQPEGINWLRDGLWDLLRIRARAALAAAFSERTWQEHPWPSRDWELIADAANRVLSLCLQAESTVNDIPLELPVFRLTVRYGANDARTEKIDKNGSLAESTAGFESSASVPSGQLTVSFGWLKSNDRVFATFKEVLADELREQLSISTDASELWARDSITKQPAEPDVEQLWDLRVRFTDFMRRFVLVLRNRPVHPFVAFLLQPKHARKIDTTKGIHVRSGLFGYGYCLDPGQMKYVEAEHGKPAVLTLQQERVEFPWGQCSQVFLRGCATDPHDSDHARSESSTTLAPLEDLLLHKSTLMEISVVGTPSMYDLDAPDGPEFILGICLPKQAQPLKSVGALQSPNANPVGATKIIRERIAAAVRTPADSFFEDGEAQVLREMGQKLIGKYASAYGRRAPRLTDASPMARRVMRAMPSSDSKGSPFVVGTSKAMERIRYWLDVAARETTTVLLQGESGVGKEVIARAFHAMSPRHSRPFVAVNCAAIPEALIESELFGHVRGAFTGAIDRKGKFELADTGTVFLDEVGDMTAATQVKVLRVLQEREFERVGSEKTRRIDVRVIAATNKRLREEVARGQFREDLYYRLSVVPLVIPPLRDRREDIPVFIEYFVSGLCAERGWPARQFSADAVDALVAAQWPGNVRQLKHWIERLLLITGDRREVTAVDVQMVAELEALDAGSPGIAPDMTAT